MEALLTKVMNFEWSFRTLGVMKYFGMLVGTGVMVLNLLVCGID